LVNCNNITASDLFGVREFSSAPPAAPTSPSQPQTTSNRYLQDTTSPNQPNPTQPINNNIATVNLTSSQNTTYSFNFICQDYQFLKVDNFGFTRIATDNIQNQEKCLNFTSSLTLYTDKECQLTSWLQSKVVQCKGEHNCTLTLDTTDLRSKCNYDKNDAIVYLAYICYDKYIHIATYDIDRSIWAYIVSATDVFCMVGLIVTLIIISRAQNNNKKSFYEHNELINKYTIRINNVDIDYQNIKNEVDQLIVHIRTLTDDKVNRLNAEAEQQIKLQTKKSNIERQNANVHVELENITNNPQFQKPQQVQKLEPHVQPNVEIIKLSENNFIYEINCPNISQNILDLINKKTKLVKFSNSLKIKYYYTKIGGADKTKLLAIEDKYKVTQDQIIDIDKQITHGQQTHAGRIHDIFITFVNSKVALNLAKMYNKSTLTRCCYILCCNYKKIKHLYFNKCWLSIQFCPDDPINIKWRNMTYSSAKRCCLKALSISLAIIILFIGFGIIILGKIIQDDVNKSFDLNLNCNLVDYNIQQVIFESSSTMPSKAKVKTFCYCKDMLDTDGYFYTMDYTLPNTTIQPCAAWLNAYTKSSLITYGIIVVIPLINVLLKTVIIILTEVERNKTLTDDKNSNIAKLSLSQYFNVALTILLVNVSIDSVKNWNSGFPIFTGDYTDMSPTWFMNIGGTITFAMILNIVVPHIMNLFFFMLRYIRRCCESGNLVGYFSKYRTREQFASMYYSPEFRLDVRYGMVRII
jgi:hypothetical protein